MTKPTKNPSGVFSSGLTAEQFLARHWQKKPLLMRKAVTDIEQLVDLDTLMALASRDDVEARLISRRGKNWSVQNGPLENAYFATLPVKNWTLLVQDLQHHVKAAWKLLAQFNFIPYARLDDLMVSYAVDGGGVGPHYDSYDVFLIQARGRRRWRIARKFDRRLRNNVPLKMIEAFEAEEEWLLDAGDMLYLPPDYAHEGTAVGECVTLSVGFRAPRAYELALAYLEELAVSTDYGELLSDADLAATATPARLDDAIVARYRRLIETLDWHHADFAEFLGIYLSEPKPQTEFDAPLTPLRRMVFAQRARVGGLRLNAKTRALYRRRQFFMNGDHALVPATDSAALAKLANFRQVGPFNWAEETITLLYSWYIDGFLEPDDLPQNA